MRMPSTNKRPTLTLPTSPAQEHSLPVSQDELPAASESVALGDILGTDAERLGWVNSVRYRVSRQLLLLRREQGMKQKEVAKAAGTSQSAIARIESGEENITLDTVEKLVNGMDGHFDVFITPASNPTHRWPDWSLSTVSTKATTLEWVTVFTALHDDGNHAVVGLKRSGTVPLIIDDKKVA